MDKNIIKIFKYVQKIPYRVCKFEKEKITYKLKYGDCRHKAFLLKTLLEKQGYEVMEIKVIFDWKDLPIPKEIISILKKSSTIWPHDSLKVKIKNRWVKIDPTWNPELEKKGFPITKKWDGKTDTKQVTEGKLKFYKKEKYIKKNKINLDEAKMFAEILNEYLAA